MNMHILKGIGLMAMIVVGISACTVPETTPAAIEDIAPEGVYAADISMDGSFAVVSAVGTDIKVWSLTDNQMTFSWQHQGYGTNLVDNVHISADQSVAVTADSEAFAVWDITSGEPQGFWRLDESTIRDIAVNNSGTGVLVGKANGSVMFFEPDTNRRLEFLGHQEKVNSVDLSPNGKFALSGSNDYKAYLWSTDTGQVIHVFSHPNRVTMVNIDDKGRYLFTADSQDDASIWDAQTGKLVSSLHFIERQLVFTSARFSEDGKHLLTGSPAKRLALWDVQTGKLLKQWRVSASKGPAPQSAVVYAVGFEQQKVLSISSSGKAEYWHE